MYEEHWNLKSEPFDQRFDPHFYYPSESHQAVLLKLSYAFESRRPAVVLCGDSGTGKTMLVESCLARIPDGIAPIVRIPYPAMPADQLIRYIARQFEPEIQPEPSALFSHSIEILDRYLRRNMTKGQHALVIIDESQLLDTHGSLHALRMLLNLAADEARSESAWTFCLIGGISLLGQIARYGDLEDRIAVRCALERFSLEETTDYILYRLRLAGNTGYPIFTEHAIEVIQEASLGVPRRINRICDLSLMIGYAQDLKQIDAPVVHIARQELFSRAAAA